MRIIASELLYHSLQNVHENKDLMEEKDRLGHSLIYSLLLKPKNRMTNQKSFILKRCAMMKPRTKPVRPTECNNCLSTQRTKGCGDSPPLISIFLHLLHQCNTIKEFVRKWRCVEIFMQPRSCSENDISP